MATTKEGVYNRCTLRNLGNNPNGTRMDIVFDAMDEYAKLFAIEVLKELTNTNFALISKHTIKDKIEELQSQLPNGR